MDIEHGPLIGPLNEDKTKEALIYIQEKQITIANSRIIEFTHWEKYSPEDFRGEDFRITLENGVSVPLQVKSSERAKRRFERQSRIHKSFIPVIVITGVEQFLELVEKIKNLLDDVAKFFARKRDKLIYAERRRIKKQSFRCLPKNNYCMCH